MQARLPLSPKRRNHGLLPTLWGASQLDPLKKLDSIIHLFSRTIIMARSVQACVKQLLKSHSNAHTYLDCDLGFHTTLASELDPTPTLEPELDPTPTLAFSLPLPRRSCQLILQRRHPPLKILQHLHPSISVLAFNLDFLIWQGMSGSGSLIGMMSIREEIQVPVIILEKPSVSCGAAPGAATIAGSAIGPFALPPETGTSQSTRIATTGSVAPVVHPLGGSP